MVKTKDTIEILEKQLDLRDLIYFKNGAVKSIIAITFTHNPDDSEYTSYAFDDGTEARLNDFYDDIDYVKYKHCMKDRREIPLTYSELENEDCEEDESSVIENVLFGLLLEFDEIDKEEFFLLPSKKSKYFHFLDHETIHKLREAKKTYGFELVFWMLSMNYIIQYKKRIKGHTFIKTSFFYSIVSDGADPNAFFKSCPLDSILHGEDAIKYDADEMLSLTDWYKPIPFLPKGFYYTRDLSWEWFPFSSNIELNFLDKLQSFLYFKVLRGQHLAIPYSKRKQTKYYYPDIVLLNQQNYICIIEVKPLYDMPSEANLRKYRYLQMYSKENGFKYTMCDDDFHDLNYLSHYKYDLDLKNIVVHMLNTFKQINHDQIYDIIQKFSKYYLEEEIKIQIAALIYQNNLYFKGNFSGAKKIIISRKKNSLI